MCRPQLVADADSTVMVRYPNGHKECRSIVRSITVFEDHAVVCVKESGTDEWAFAERVTGPAMNVIRAMLGVDQNWSTPSLQASLAAD